MSDHLYFIRVKDGPVKIGRAGNVQRRLKHLQIGCPYELILVGTVEHGGSWEWVFHAKLFRDCIRGEWFEWTRRVERMVGYALDPVRWRTKLKLPEPKDESFEWRLDSPLYAKD